MKLNPKRPASKPPKKCPACGQEGEWKVEVRNGEMVTYILISCPLCRSQFLWKSSLPKVWMKISPESAVV